MRSDFRPVVISSPLPRSIELIFSAQAEERLRRDYELIETDDEGVARLPDVDLTRTRYVLGQPPLSEETLQKMSALRCIFNVESNLLNNMPYEMLFQRGVHVVTTGQVFAQPVAEMGLAMALNLARGIIDGDVDFRAGSELWGYGSNQTARLLCGADVGIVGFGDLGRALNRLLSAFRTRTKVYDPWLPQSILADNGVIPASLDDVLSTSDFVFVVASVTSDNQGFLGADAFARMREGAAFILLSRAGVVDFDALMDAVESGRIVAASDVYPQEPLPPDHRVRRLKGFIRSAHRAGALASAFKMMGDMVLEDMDLIDRGLPPMRCKRAERETVARMRSKPVERT